MTATRKRFKFDDHGHMSNELAMYLNAAGRIDGVQAELQNQLSSGNVNIITSEPSSGTINTGRPLGQTSSPTNTSNITFSGGRPLPAGSTVTITSPTGVAASAPVIDIMPNLGGGAGGPAPEKTNELVVTKKKSNLFPWLLLATGVFLIVKQPLK